MNHKTFAGKSFILVIPNDYGIYKLFNYNLEQLGFDLLPIIPREFRYISILDRLHHFYRKTFFKDRSRKKKLIKSFHCDCVGEKIKDLSAQSIDYVLIIRPDMLDLKTLDQLKKIGKKVVAYQWDGLERFPDVFSYIGLFENFLVFDRQDFNRYKAKYANLRKSENFYFDFDRGGPNIHDSKMVYYVGSYIADRSHDLIFLMQELEKYDLDFDVNLRHSSSKLPFEKKNIKFFKHNIDFEANIGRLKKARFLLDFKVAEHNGLSLRFFEALKYEKKMITTNKSVMDYNFYDSQNVFILNHDDLNTLPQFIESPYRPVPLETVEQYSFSHWLQKYVI